MKLAAYELEEHRHRFAVWAAARAAQRRFAKVGILRKAVEDCEVREFVRTPANLDNVNDARFISIHQKWCHQIIASLVNSGIATVPFGRAAKLLAVYLKCVVVLGQYSESAFARVCHPPIDSLLLKAVANSHSKSRVALGWAKSRWTKLNEQGYYKLVAELRRVLDSNDPFWKLEYYWPVTSEH